MSIFEFIMYGRSYLGDIIGGPAVVMLATMFYFALLRILIGFVVRLFKGQWEYKSALDKSKRVGIDNTTRGTLFDSIIKDMD